MSRWSSVAVLAAGPETDLAEAGRALKGAGTALSEACAIVEDGRMHVSASGLCFMEADDDKPAVVFTCAAVIAPFLAKRPVSAGRSTERRRLRAAVDAALVPTTEFFVIFSEATSTSQGVLGSYAANLVACVPMPSAEFSFESLQSVCPQIAPEAAKKDTRNAGSLSWQLPAIGSLGLAVLHVHAAPTTGTPLSLSGARRIAAASAVGSMVRLHVSPFGTLKPSLFLNTESRGLIAGGSADADVGLLLLDARCLPGSEGGVVVSDEQDTEQVPLAMVAPPLRSDTVTMGTAIPLSTVALALATALPGRVLHKVVGLETSRVLQAAAEGAGLKASLGSAFSEDFFDTTSTRVEEIPQSLRCSLCDISIGDSTSMAVALSAHGHLLVRAELLQTVERQSHAWFRCSISRSLAYSGDEVDTFFAARDAHVLHIFECFSNLALVLLRHTDETDSGPVLPSFLYPLEVSSAPLPEIMEEGAEVWSLKLPASKSSHPARLLSGNIARVVTGRARWNPVLLESSHGHPLGESTMLLRSGSRFSLLGFSLPGSESQISPAILPHRILNLAIPQLEPLQIVIRSLDNQLRGLDLLARFDKAWSALAAIGLAQMIFRIEASSAANVLDLLAEVGGRKLPRPALPGSSSQLRSAL